MEMCGSIVTTILFLVYHIGIFCYLWHKDEGRFFSTRGLYMVELLLPIGGTFMMTIQVIMELVDSYNEYEKRQSRSRTILKEKEDLLNSLSAEEKEIQKIVKSKLDKIISSGDFSITNDDNNYFGVSLTVKSGDNKISCSNSFYSLYSRGEVYFNNVKVVDSEYYFDYFYKIYNDNIKSIVEESKKQKNLKILEELKS